MSASPIHTLAGVAATATFIASALPMLVKAFRTKDLASYSPGNLGLATAGNALYWAYVAGLPFGPIWLLHAFNTATTLLMLLWYLAYRCHGRRIGHGPPNLDRRRGPASDDHEPAAGTRLLRPCSAK
ncbi:MAG TPA: hypothetical protein VFU81_10405 [Thermomicrobiales bacterium]|nr:hypothetical protein [Thermomicrobiales bacterium]